MCVIILGENKHIPLDILKKAEKTNPHGAGLAWINDKKEVEYIKSEKLTAQNIFDFIKSEKIKLPYVIHFRITSVGDTCDQLCHPFKLSSNDNTIKGIDKNGVLFHNGTYHGYKMDLNLWKLNKNTPKNDKEFKGKMSDSRAMSLMANKNRLGLAYLKLIPNGNKLVVLTPKGIKKFGNGWSKVEGLECSNNYFDNTYDYFYESCEGSYYTTNNKKTQVSNQSCLTDKSKDLKNKINMKNTKNKESEIDTMLYDLREIIENTKEEQIHNESELANIEEYLIDMYEEESLKLKREELEITLSQSKEEYKLVYNSHLKKLKGFLYATKNREDFLRKHASFYNLITQEEAIYLQ